MSVATTTNLNKSKYIIVRSKLRRNTILIEQERASAFLSFNNFFKCNFQDNKLRQSDVIS